MSSWGTDQFQSTVLKFANNTFYVVLKPLPTIYTSGMRVCFKATASISGQAYVNLSGLTQSLLGSVAIFRPDGSATQTGDIVDGQVVTIIYAGTSFHLNSWPQATPYVPPTRFTSGLSAIPGSGGSLGIAHGLAAIPFYWKVVLVQNHTGTQDGYAQNTEVGLGSVVDSGGLPVFATSADAININVSQVNTVNLYLIPYGGGALVQITTANWKVKVYASL